MEYVLQTLEFWHYFDQKVREAPLQYCQPEQKAVLFQ